VLGSRRARRDIGELLDRGRRKCRQGQDVQEIRGRMGQGEVDGQRVARVDLDARNRVAGHVGGHRGGAGARNLCKSITESLQSDNERLVVGQAAERLGRITGSFEATNLVGAGDLPGRRGVPHRTGLDGDLVGQAVGTDIAVRRRRHLCRQVGDDVGHMADHCRIGEELAAPQPQGQISCRVIGNVRIHVVDVAGAQHRQSAAHHRRAAAVGVRLDVLVGRRGGGCRSRRSRSCRR
jgi:hypothetical protein